MIKKKFLFWFFNAKINRVGLVFCSQIENRTKLNWINIQIFSIISLLIYYILQNTSRIRTRLENPNSLSRPLSHFYSSSVAPIPHLSNSISLRLNTLCLHLTSPLHVSVSCSHRSKTHKLEDTHNSSSHSFILLSSLSIVCNLWHWWPSSSLWVWRLATPGNLPLRQWRHPFPSLLSCHIAFLLVSLILCNSQ